MRHAIYLHMLLIASIAALALLFVTDLSGAGSLTLEFDDETHVEHEGYETTKYEIEFTVRNDDMSNEANFSVFWDEKPITAGGQIEASLVVDGDEQEYGNNVDVINLPPDSDSREEGHMLKVVVEIGKFTDATDYSEDVHDLWENGYRFPFKLKDEDDPDHGSLDIDDISIEVERRSGMRASAPTEYYEGNGSGILVGTEFIMNIEVENMGNFKDTFAIDVEDVTNGEMTDVEDYWWVHMTSSPGDDDSRDEDLEVHSFSFRIEEHRKGLFALKLRVGVDRGIKFDYGTERFTVSEGEHDLTLTVESNSNAESVGQGVISDTVTVTVLVIWPSPPDPEGPDGGSDGSGTEIDMSHTLPIMLGVICAGCGVAPIAFFYQKRKDDEESMGWGDEESMGWGDEEDKGWGDEEDKGWGDGDEDIWNDSFDEPTNRSSPVNSHVRGNKNTRTASQAGLIPPVTSLKPSEEPGKKKMSAAGYPVRIKCPKCSVTIVVKNPMRPLKINCPKCMAGITLKVREIRNGTDAGASQPAKTSAKPQTHPEPIAAHPVRIKCPGCSVTMTVKNQRRPLRISCPKCETCITLKDPAAAPAGISAGEGADTGTGIHVKRTPSAEDPRVPSRIRCPGCSVAISVKNPKRPLRFDCPKCRTTLTIK